MSKRALLGVLALLGAAGCARPPVEIDRGPFAAISVARAQQGDLSGERVRWGGTIVHIETGKSETCFEIVGRPLDRSARPKQTDESLGRFLACAGGFFDPAVYAAGREVTVVGSLRESVEGRIGEREYRYPKVEAERVYLWPTEEEYLRRDSYYEPYWYPPPVYGPYPYPPAYPRPRPPPPPPPPPRPVPRR